MPGPNATESFLVALDAVAGKVPEWVHLLPLGRFIATGHGQYSVDDPTGVIANSAPLPLAIDETHSTEYAAPLGLPAPARGWIVALETRADGIWGKVDWTDSGKQLVSERAYRQMSSVIQTDKQNRVTRIWRAALTNNPAVPQLAAFQRKPTMEFLAKLREALGLGEHADETTALAAIAVLKKRPDVDATALQTALAPIAKAAGVAGAEAASPTAVLAAVTALAATAQNAMKPETITALQAELVTVGTELAALKSNLATERATTFVDGAIKQGRVGIKPMRDHYIAMHAQDAARVEKEIGAMPILGPSGAGTVPPKPAKDGEIALSAEHVAAARLVGVPLDALKKTLAAEAANEEAA